MTLLFLEGFNRAEIFIIFLNGESLFNCTFHTGLKENIIVEGNNLQYCPEIGQISIKTHSLANEYKEQIKIQQSVNNKLHCPGIIRHKLVFPVLGDIRI